MIFSFVTLKKLANLPSHVTVEDVAKAINSIGFEVEGYEKFGDIAGVKFGKVLKTYKNPDADKLTVCEIEFSDKNRVIQTNATNVEAGKYLIAFVPGSRSKNVTFAPKVMKGIESEGMLASLNEIGFNTEYVSDEWKDGIFVFDEAVDLSLDPIEYFELDDYLIDITILSNRADANAYLVMARELSAYFETDMQKPEDIKNATFESNYSVKYLENTNHFTLRELKTQDINISLKDKLFLFKNSVKSISKPVDLTNLVLLYSGCPAHAYDTEKLDSKHISVEKYTGKVEILGQKEIELENALCVKDAKKVISVASVIGLENSSCSASTKDALLEIASFDLKEIRYSKKQVKLETNSANRASKEISLGSIELAHKYVSSKVSGSSQIINFEKPKAIVFDFDKDYLNRYAGFDIVATQRYQKVKNQLAKLGIVIKEDRVEVEPYRFDLTTMQDLTEEVFRFYGYDNFVVIQPDLKNTKNQDIKDYDEILKSMKYQNVRTFTLTNAKNNVFDPFKFTDSIKLKTFASADRVEIRLSMAYSLFEVLEYNKKRKISAMSIYEIGSIHDKSNVLGLASNKKSFSQMKQDIVDLFDAQLTFKRVREMPFHPNYSTLIYKGEKLVGYIAKIHPEIFNSNAIYAEIFLDEDVKQTKLFENYKHDPLKQRDFTITMAQKQDILTLLDETKNLKGIYKVMVTDKYFKEDGSVNVTLSFLVEDWAIAKLEKVFEKFN